MNLVGELARAGFAVQVNSAGGIVVGHRLDLHFEQYKLQRINKVSPLHTQERRARKQAPNPLGLNTPPTDKYEYWDYLTEKALETHKRLADNETERIKTRLENQAELRKAMEEVWGTPQLLTLRSFIKDTEEKQAERLKQEKELREQVMNPTQEAGQ